MINPAILHSANIDPVVKFVGYLNTSVSTDPATAIAQYATAEKNASIIQTTFGVPIVPSPGLLIHIALINSLQVVKEQVSLDMTNATTFWVDIQNWLYAKNSFDIEFDSPSYKIKDPTNSTYVLLDLSV